MVKVKKNFKNYYVSLSRQLIRDERLSWKARGIMAYLWDQSDEWNFHQSEVVKHSADGVDSLRSGLHELEKFGYLTRKRVRKENGNWGDTEWVLNQEPTVKPFSPKLDNPIQDKAIQENAIQENPTLRTTNNKVYQSKELPIKRKRYSAADAAPSIPFKEIVEYLNEKAGRNYKPSTPATKKFIKARWNEGFRLNDFKKVIDVKTDEWKGTDFDYCLRPQTLFGTKFEAYSNQKPKNQPTYYGGGQVADNLPW